MCQLRYGGGISLHISLAIYITTTTKKQLNGPGNYQNKHKHFFIGWN